MNYNKLLNEALFPRAGDNVRRKDYPYYDTLAITTGQTDYYFFTSPLGNPFLRNTKLPLSGQEIFFVDSISMYLNTVLSTTALIGNLNALLQQSCLQISVNSRVQCKLPLMDLLQYQLVLAEDATPAQLQPTIYPAMRKLPIPIIMNSASSFEFKLTMPTAVATAFNTVPIKLALHGVQLDKLDSFYWDDLKNNKFQQVPVTYYDNATIVNGNETTYNFFANNNKAQNLISQVFPLSETSTFSLQNIEVMISQPDTPIVPSTIFNSRINNLLRISVDDVDYYNASMQDMLSVVASYGGNLTDSATNTTAYVTTMNVRQSKTLRVPIEFPAQSKVIVSLTQPGSSLGVTGGITVALRGVETRRVQ